MTNANLQPATKWLAERAGYFVSDTTPDMVWDKPFTDSRDVGDATIVCRLPGSQRLGDTIGSYTSEQVGTILSWLAKAGYVPQVDSTVELKPGWKAEQPIEEMFGEHIGYVVGLFGDVPDHGLPNWTGYGEALEAALTAAVVALYESENQDDK